MGCDHVWCHRGQWGGCSMGLLLSGLASFSQRVLGCKHFWAGIWMGSVELFLWILYPNRQVRIERKEKLLEPRIRYMRFLWMEKKKDNKWRNKTTKKAHCFVPTLGTQKEKATEKIWNFVECFSSTSDGVLRVIAMGQKFLGALLCSFMKWIKMPSICMCYF